MLITRQICNLQTRKRFNFSGLQSMTPGTSDSEKSPLEGPHKCITLVKTELLNLHLLQSYGPVNKIQDTTSSISRRMTWKFKKCYEDFWSHGRLCNLQPRMLVWFLVFIFWQGVPLIKRRFWQNKKLCTANNFILTYSNLKAVRMIYSLWMFQSLVLSIQDEFTYISAAAG